MEFLVILAIAVFILLIGITLSAGQQSLVISQKEVSDTRNSLYDLSSAAKEVYAQGEGSKKHVFVQLPSSYDASASRVGNNSIRLRVAGSDYASLENFNVHGYLPNSPGGHWVWVVSEGNRVRIGDAMMQLDKNRIYIVMNSNSSASTSFLVQNVWIRDINVTTTVVWSNPPVSMLGVPSAFSLNTNSSTSIGLDFASSDTASGVYTGQITLRAVDSAGISETIDVPVTVQVIPPGSTLPAPDLLGPIVVGIYNTPSPVLKLQLTSLYVNVTDSLTGNHTISGCLIAADNSANWSTMLPVDGAYDQVTELAEYNYTSGFALGPHTFRVECADSLNNTGPTAYYYFNVSESDTLGPIIISLYHPAGATTLSNITVGGIATEAYTGNNNIAGCNLKIDSSGSWIPVTPDDGAWDSPTENFSYTTAPLGVGSHTLFYQCTDSIGNLGGIYNDTVGIVDVDLMLVLDRSGSMAETVTYAVKNNVVSASSTGWSWVKNLTVNQTNGNLANLSTQIKASSSGCTVFYNATINGLTVANGSRTSTSYGTIVVSIPVSNYSIPYTVDLWLKRDLAGCTASNQLFSLTQQPTKLVAAKDSSSLFVDIAGNNVQLGMTSFSSTATLDRQLLLMTSLNQDALKTAINALVASGGTCIQCGIQNAADELTSVRARPNATKIIILLTDGVSTSGNSVTGAVYARDRNITVHTIGFGDSVDETELTNIALLTYGDYYFAPNAQTLTNIFENIGRH